MCVALICELPGCTFVPYAGTAPVHLTGVASAVCSWSTAVAARPLRLSCEATQVVVWIAAGHKPLRVPSAFCCRNLLPMVGGACQVARAAWVVV
jgi:hypothetical protein